MRRPPLTLLLALTACAGEPKPTAEPDVGSTDTDEVSHGADPDDDDDENDDTADPPVLENRLANPSFEQGETWWRTGGAVHHAWARTGDRIYGSDATFTALEGNAAEKIWGLYAGTVPNDSEHGLTLTELTPGDVHTFSIRAMTASPDVLTGGTAAVAFLRYTDATGNVLLEVTSDPIDQTSATDSWHTLSVEAEVPADAAGGALGVRFTLPDWSATGSVYLDDASWTSSGTGSVEGERMLVWHDEFDGPSLDLDKWTHELLAPYTFNNEVQRYTDADDVARIEDGLLVITAGYDTSGEVHSARLVSAGKGDWQYGRIEGLLVGPAGVGTWPAMWMLPTHWRYGGWPDSGEIDIMEHVGCQPDVVHATVHTGAYNHLLGTQQGASLETTATSQMHLYAVDWTAERIVFTVDGRFVMQFDNDGAGDPATWPFDQPFHLVLNLAFGGDWGGYCGIDWGALPQQYRLDWVRVYQFPSEG